jgi:surfeit locus 1 family protein
VACRRLPCHLIGNPRDRTVPARSLIAVAFGVLVCVGAVALGQWQLRRAEAKLALQRQWDEASRAAPVALRGAELPEFMERLPVRVRLVGTFEPERLVWLDNRALEGRPGMRAVMAMRLEDGTRVMVDRGWWPRDRENLQRLPGPRTPVGVVQIDGLAVGRAPRLLELGTPPPESDRLPALWQNLDYERLERVLQAPVAHVLVQQTSAMDDGLVRETPRFDAGVDRHRGYAFQWFALAALSAGLTSFFGWRAWRAGHLVR